MVGFGAGVCYPAGILIVNEYFNESRGLANGLSLVGTTVGSIAMPPYIMFLTSSYGYRGGILIVSGMMLNVLACALTYKPAQDKHTPDVQFPDTMTTSSSSSSSRSSINARVAAATVVRVTDEYCTAVESCCTSSINTSVRVTTTAIAADDIVTTDEYYADVVVSSPLLEHHVQHRGKVARLRRTFSGRPTAVLLAVTAVNALSELAYGTFAATSTPRPSNTKAALWLAAADATGRVLVPAVSDHLSTGNGGGSASIYLNAVIMAVGGAVLLTAGSARQSQTTEWSLCLIAAFGLVSGAAVGLEPLVAVHVLGHDRLPTSYSATMLAKGAAGLAVHLLFSPMAGHHDHSAYRPPQHRIPANIALYVLGSCLVAAAAGWTARLLFRPHFYTPRSGFGQYMRAA
ncbi:Hypothetical protein CINCED_3A019293 [Cinara cedri]|nr:Hypothetical protein CINCED_3A019293 [Cinara cedri]